MDKEAVVTPLTTRLHDKARLLAYLQSDRLYAAYAIGDLEPDLFEQSTWAGAEEHGELQALALHFRGLKLPALFLMGDNPGLRAILRHVLRPDRAYLTCRSEHLPVTSEFYTWGQTVPMWRMVLQTTRFQPSTGQCLRLTPDSLQELLELYAQGGGDAFGPLQLQQGVFYGVHLGERLVAAAGTHLVSPTYSVAAVGNVFTHPHYRGQGLASTATSSVVAELLRQGIHDIVLNVSQDNAVAIRVYEHLGFQPYCAFVEGPAWERPSSSRERQPVPSPRPRP